ncbi:hypothetical protein BU15DRAFT_77732 [Melanogaster broomeanus]|nr:hypothetical protein BU15DRAFT_77732 [Melanogaster broomeanus]
MSMRRSPAVRAKQPAAARNSERAGKDQMLKRAGTRLTQAQNRADPAPMIRMFMDDVEREELELVEKPDHVFFEAFMKRFLIPVEFKFGRTAKPSPPPRTYSLQNYAAPTPKLSSTRPDGSDPDMDPETELPEVVPHSSQANAAEQASVAISVGLSTPATSGANSKHPSEDDAGNGAYTRASGSRSRRLPTTYPQPGSHADSTLRR